MITKDRVETITNADELLVGLKCTGKMSAETVEAFQKLVYENAHTRKRFVFLDEWLEQHRRLIRHAYRTEKCLFWATCYPGSERRVYKMSRELRALCAEYLQMRKSIRS